MWGKFETAEKFQVFVDFWWVLVFERSDCFGTVTNSGFRKNVMHWTITFDEEDAAVYDNNERGQLEDLDYNELMDAFELYEELKEDDPKKP